MDRDKPVSLSEIESSESDAETDNETTFHRRVSTMKELKCSVSNYDIILETLPPYPNIVYL